MTYKKIHYQIIFLCSLAIANIFSQPEKESMEYNPKQKNISGKVLALSCAGGGCCLGTALQTAGYGVGPCQGAACGLTCSITLLPVLLNGITYYAYKKKKEQ